jgi:hypothetical protein
MIPVTLHISVGDYLKFEVSHNYTPGRDTCHWSVKQFNGPAIDPMVLSLFGGEEVGPLIIKHLLNEIMHYIPEGAIQHTQNVLMRMENGGSNALAYEGLLTLPPSIDHKIFNTYAIEPRFKAIFDLFCYMVHDVPF